MKGNRLLGLLVVTGVAVIIAVIISAGGGSSAVAPQVGKAVLPDLAQHLGDAERVTLVHGGNKATLARDGEEWVVAEKGGYPADTAKVRQMLLGLAQLSYVEPKTRKPEYYSRLELEDPAQKDAKSTLVTVSDGKGGMLGEVIVGKRRIDELGGGTDGVYVRKPGGDVQTWLARGSLDVAGDATQWLDRKLVDLPQEKIKEAVLTQPDGTKLAFGRDKPEDALALKGAPANIKLKSDTVLVEPAGALAGLELSDVRPAAELPVPSEGVARAEYTTFDGLVVKLSLFQQDGKDWARIEASGTGDAEKSGAELDAKLAKWVYALPDYRAKTLKTKLADVAGPPKSS